MVFRSAPMALGLTTEGSIVSVQPFIVGELPTQDEVDDFLIAAGFADVRRQCFLWSKQHENLVIWLGDARDENFVKTADCIVPIDVRMWI